MGHTGLPTKDATSTTNLDFLFSLVFTENVQIAAVARFFTYVILFIVINL